MLTDADVSPCEVVWSDASPSHRGIRKSGGRDTGHLPRRRDEWMAYHTLERATGMKLRIAYGGRPLRQRSPNSSPRPGKPVTWRSGTGGSAVAVWRYA